MTDRDDMRARADEFALGLLDDAEEARLLAEAETDEALREALAAARDRFVELDLAVQPARTPDALWDRIEARLDAAEEAGAPPPPPEAANDNAAPLRRGVRAVAIAASVVLAFALGWSFRTEPEPKVIAVLLTEAGEPLALVEDFGGAEARVTPLVDIEVPDGRTMQVWTKPSEERGPVSLGLMDTASTMVLRGPDLPPPREQQLYEITLERAGGSPTGLPTGPILAKGLASGPR